MEEKEMPPDVLASVVWLEAKQVLRGTPSEMFPDLTFAKARIIRMMGFEKFKEVLLEGLKHE